MDINQLIGLCAAAFLLVLLALFRTDDGKNES